MAPPDLTTLSPPSEFSNVILPYLDVNVGPNVLVKNSNSGGFDIKNLQFKTASIISSAGLNISTTNGTSKLTISKDGVINSLGSITTSSSLNSTSLNIGNNTMTVSDTGLIFAADDLTIGATGKFKVTAATGALSAGTLTINGGISATETVTIGGTTNLPAITLSNTGAVSISGASILSSSLSVSGVGTFSSDLGVGGNLRVSGSFALGSSLDVSGACTFGSTLYVNGASTFAGTVDISGASTFADTLDVTGASTFDSTLAVAGASTFGSTLSITDNLSIGGVNSQVLVKADTGSISTFLPYSGYIANASSTNTTFTVHSTTDEPVFDSSTNNLLTTQEYVDKQIWGQTKRINTILGKDSNELDNFNKVYDVLTKISGDSDLVRTLQDTNDKYYQMVDKTSEITTSMSDIVSYAYNVVNVNCSRSVWADACPPLPVPKSVTSNPSILFNEEGWYYRNYSATVNGGKKINWYLPSSSLNITVADIKNLYLNVFAISNKSLPNITFYTAAKGDSSDYWPGLVNAKVSYYFDSPTTPTSSTANKGYCLYTNQIPINIYNKEPVKPKTTGIYTTNANNRNNYSGLSAIDSSIISGTDVVLFLSIQTDSSHTANNVEVVINSLNVALKSGTTKFAFSNSSVATNYLFNNSLNKHIDFSDINSIEKAHLESYTATHLTLPSTV